MDWAKLRVLEDEKQKLYQMIETARQQGVPMAADEIVQAQSRKIDALIAALYKK